MFFQSHYLKQKGILSKEIHKTASSSDKRNI